MERLRGNTFLLLLLRAGCQVLLNPQEYGESKDGVTKPNMLADLIRLTNPKYQPAKLDTLSSYFSKYLSGDPPRSPAYLPFSNPAYQFGLQSRIADGYPAVLRQMDRFCCTYLTQENFPLRLLVGGIVDAILADDSFDGEFDVGDRIVAKAELNDQKKFLLQPFLASVWSNILANHPDTSEGQQTYLEWTKDAGYNTAREITTKIGAERAKKIAVSANLPEEMLADAAVEDDAEPAEPDVTVDEIHEDKPRVEVYEAPFTNPQTGEKVVAQFHVEARDNGIATGILYGGIHIDRRKKDD
jgi:hypothetical protein